MGGRIPTDYDLNCVAVAGVVVEGSFVFGEGVFFNLFEVIFCFLIKVWICRTLLHGCIFHIRNMCGFQDCDESFVEVLRDSFVVGKVCRFVAVDYEFVAGEIEEVF